MAATMGGLALDGRLVVLGADQKPMQLVTASLIGRRTGNPWLAFGQFDRLGGHRCASAP
jgi:hypothetical protein